MPDIAGVEAPSNGKSRTSSDFSNVSGLGRLPRLQKDPLAAIWVDRPKPPKLGVVGYTFLSLLCILPVSGATILLWSESGLGRKSFTFLAYNSDKRQFFFAASAVLLFGLYLLDFFLPPQLPGKFLVLWEGDWCVGRASLGLAVLLFSCGALLLAKENPFIPLIMSSFISLVLVGSVRVLLRWKQPVGKADDIVKGGSQRKKLMLMTAICWKEQDTMRYYISVVVAFALAGSGCVLWFMVYVMMHGKPDQTSWEEDLHVPAAAHVRFMLWSAPLLVGLVNFTFALFALFRVCVQPIYVLTNTTKLALMAGHISPRAFGSIELNAAEGTPIAPPIAGSDMLSDGDMRQRSMDGGSIGFRTSGRSYEINLKELERGSEERTKQLSFKVKCILYIFLLLLGCLYVALEFLYVDNYIATTSIVGLCLFFVGFVIFSHATLRRIMRAMGTQLVEGPVWKFVQSVANSDWMRAVLFPGILFLMPFVLPLSALNQCVRKCRLRAALATHSPAKTVVRFDNLASPTSLPEKAAARSGALRLLTPRVGAVLTGMLEWDWLSVLSKCYILCFVILCFKICPLLLNVVLAWMTVELAKMSFWVILVSIFIIGTIAFLLPPVPGMTVYMFGGLVISNPKACPYGFWGGTLINIAFMWVLKLFACAVQQKCIGETLGRSLWVRHQAQVHKLSIRCIEAVMRQPGLSFDKVAILCGGPDWPVSVLAGILHLPLAQCELGTMPVIGFVAPCALSGSFYLKWNLEGNEFWRRCANLMIFTALGISACLWVVAGWGMQRQLEENLTKLKQPKPQNVDLEWLDYKVAKLAKVCQPQWGCTPLGLRLLYAGGALVQLALCGAFFTPYFLGDFQVYHGIENMRWIHDGDEEDSHGVFTVWAIAGLALYVAAGFCPVPYKIWRHRRTKHARVRAERELHEEERGWKENRFFEVAAWKEFPSEEPSPVIAGNESPVFFDEPSPSQVEERARQNVWPDADAQKLPTQDLGGEFGEVHRERAESENWPSASDRLGEALPKLWSDGMSPHQRGGQSLHDSQGESPCRGIQPQCWWASCCAIPLRGSPSTLRRPASQSGCPWSA